jgi:hypothetical protein
MDGGKSDLSSEKLHLSARNRAICRIEEEGERSVQEETSAAAAPRKPKKGAVSSPLNTDDISVFFLL